MRYAILISVDIEEDNSVGISLESSFDSEQTIQILQRSIELLEERNAPVGITS